jgi:CheY-like chemotaxis protein
MKETPFVLFAEDDDEDWLLISEVLDETCNANIKVERVKDGQELLDWVNDGNRPNPDLIMLDLKMPRLGGLEALYELRRTPGISSIIPVVVMTTSDLETDIVKSYRTGANSYVVKPVDHERMGKALKAIHKYWTETVRLPPRHSK